MIKVTVHEAKTHLSYYLAETETGRDDSAMPPKRAHRRNSPFAGAPQDQTTDRAGKREIQG